MNWPPLRPTAAGRAALGLSLLVTLAAANTGVNLLYMVLALMLAAQLMSLADALRAGRRLRLGLQLPRRVVAGRPFTALVSLGTPRPRPGPYLLWPATGLEGRPWAAAQGSPEAGSESAWTLAATRRGRLEVVSLWLTAGSLLGLWERRLRVSSDARTLVLPRLLPIDASLDAEPRPGEAESSPDPGQGDSLRDLRPYVVGDSPRHIHWRASAKRDWPLVREFLDPRERRVLLALRLQGWRSEAAFEREVSRVASLAAAHLRHGDILELRLGSRSLDGLSGASGLELALVALALVEPVSEPLAGARA